MAQSTHQFATARSALQAFYQQGIYDEFIPPTQIGTKTFIQDGDSVLFFNFRADRTRQLTEALIAEEFHGFPRSIKPHLSHAVSMTHYADDLATEPAFPPRTLHHTLGEVIASHDLHQLRIAETEKYAHVTFFFNGGSDRPFLNEDRILIPSPNVATYNLQPEMSGPELTRRLIDAISSLQYDVIICNYANADMVGHTGDFKATVRAIEYLDTVMSEVAEALFKIGGQLLITADHGNADAMFDDKTQQPHTAHTSEPVPLMYIGQDNWQFTANKGSLCDVAPTLLTLLNITIPIEMTGCALLVNDHD